MGSTDKKDIVNPKTIPPRQGVELNLRRFRLLSSEGVKLRMVLENGHAVADTEKWAGNLGVKNDHRNRRYGNTCKLQPIKTLSRAFSLRKSAQTSPLLS